MVIVKDWDWRRQPAPLPLFQHEAAPDDIGIYELGFVSNLIFQPMYIGRAMGVTLKQRLSKHYKNSHNKNIREHRMSLYFRTKTFSKPEIVAFVEAVSIAAIDYPWNKRNEWKQHWNLEK